MEGRGGERRTREKGKRGMEGKGGMGKGGEKGKGSDGIAR